MPQILAMSLRLDWGEAHYSNSHLRIIDLQAFNHYGILAQDIQRLDTARHAYAEPPLTWCARLFPFCPTENLPPAGKHEVVLLYEKRCADSSTPPAAWQDLCSVVQRAPRIYMPLVTSFVTYRHDFYSDRSSFARQQELSDAMMIAAQPRSDNLFSLGRYRVAACIEAGYGRS